MKNENALVVFSGGQDSTTCLFWAKEKFKDVYALAFDYGQRHIEELSCAKKICEDAAIPLAILDLSIMNSLTVNSLTRKDIKVEAPKSDGMPPNSFVEGRNMVFLTFAAIYAKGKNIKHIVTGVSQSDFSGYPDCRDSFIKSQNVTLNLAMDYEFVIHTPLMWINKMETWRLADALGVLDIIKNETLTCYNGIKGSGCGECPSCKLRNRGLLEYERSL